MSDEICFGDITHIYDVCGCLGQCPKCLEIGPGEKCGNHYVYGSVCGVPYNWAIDIDDYPCYTDSSSVTDE